MASNDGSLVLCVVGSIVTGLMYTFGVVTLALPNHYAELRHEELSKFKQNVLMVIYIVINVVSVGPLMYASSQGSVSVVVPVVLASNLLSNMLIQGVVGSLVYTKPKRVGTLVLSAAAFQLIDVGPQQGNAGGVMEMIMQPASLSWLAVMIVLMTLGFAMLPCFRHRLPNSLMKLFAFTAFISVAAALNNSLAKVVSEPSLTSLAVAFTMVLYVILGAVSTIGTAYGNAGLDNAISVPVFMCMQVVMNGLTGIFVWGNWPMITEKTAYVMVYCLIVLGIYLCADVDVLTKFLLNPTPSGLTDLHDVLASANLGSLPDALQDFLKTAAEEDKIEQRDFLSLCDILSRTVASQSSVDLRQSVENWLSDYQQYHKIDDIGPDPDSASSEDDEGCA